MDVPKRYRHTVKLLEAAFPEGISAKDYAPLLRLLHEEMTFRAISAVLEFFGKDPDSTYLEASSAASAEGPSPSEVERVRAKLLPHGWEEWKAAPDIDDE